MCNLLSQEGPLHKTERSRHAEREAVQSGIRQKTEQIIYLKVMCSSKGLHILFAGNMPASINSNYVTPGGMFFHQPALYSFKTNQIDADFYEINDHSASI